MMRIEAGLPLFVRAAGHEDRIAVAAPEGTFRYGDLLAAAGKTAARLLAGSADLKEERIAYLIPPGFTYVAVQWGIWRAGGVAVPLATSYPPAELDYVVYDSGASVVVVHPEFAERVRPIAVERGLRFLLTTYLIDGADDATADLGQAPFAELTLERKAMIIYTSGTTSRPKGVVATHGNIQSQVVTLVEAWRWQATDHILLVLPLHHLHGIINILTCALWSGAQVTILPRFDAGVTWDAIASGELTLFMAVPTIYGKLIAKWEEAKPERRDAMSRGCQQVRLMVSGSAALPVTVLERWKEISGHILLERYGMTEIGMALSNPLDGLRRPGCVGIPLPGVQIRLVDEEGLLVEPGAPGEIEVRGQSVFLE